MNLIMLNAARKVAVMFTFAVVTVEISSLQPAIGVAEKFSAVRIIPTLGWTVKNPLKGTV